MNNDQQPIPIMAIAVNAHRDRHQVLVELGAQTLALAPEAATALAAALSHAANELYTIPAERPKIKTTIEQAVAPAADLLINTIAVLVDRYRQGTLQAPLLPALRAAEVNVQGGASLSAPKD